MDLLVPVLEGLAAIIRLKGVRECVEIRSHPPPIPLVKIDDAGPSGIVSKVEAIRFAGIVLGELEDPREISGPGNEARLISPGCVSLLNLLLRFH